VDVAVIGVPFDGGVTNGAGARHGPRAVREQTTMVRRYNQATGVGRFDLAEVANLGDAWVEWPFELEGALSEIEVSFAAVQAEGAAPPSVGCDHSISLRSCARSRGPGLLGMIHVDAHCDTGGDHLDSFTSS
jgi:guanidinopropionase